MSSLPLSWGAVREAVARPYRAARGRLARLAFERGAYDTGEQVELSELGVDRPELRRYEASGWFYLRRALRGTSVTADDVFVDFGSGKGRIVAQAARYPFGRVVGVEIAPELTEMARANVERVGPRRKCRRIELVTSDVLTFEIPDDMTFAYLNNPFGGEVFRGVLDHIVQSIDRRPRRLRLIYVNPVMHDAVAATQRFDLVRRSRGLRRDVFSRRIHVYESRVEPADRSGGDA